MFESVCAREPGQASFRGPGLDLGHLASSLLFYGRVHVVGRAPVLAQVVDAFGEDALYELVDSSLIDLNYYPDYPAVLTHDTGTPQARHSPGVYNFGHFELQHTLPEALSTRLGTGRARRVAKRLLPRVKTFMHDRQNVEGLAREDFLNRDYLRRAAAAALGALVPEYRPPEPLVFEPVWTDGQFIRYGTNIDFVEANARYHHRVHQSHSSLSTQYLLAFLVSARSDINMAATLAAELAPEPLVGALIRLRVDLALDKADAHAEQIERFQDFVFDEGRSVGHAIASGRRTMADLVPILRRADKFKEWLRGRPPDADLIKEYFRAVTADSWLEKAPTKLMRWLVFSGAGMAVSAALPAPIGTLVEHALGAADAFIVDRVLGGWRPSQFVNRELEPFVGGWVPSPPSA